MTPNQILEPEWLFPFHSMSVGDSFFIPTLRPAEMIYVVDSAAKRAGIRVKTYVYSKDDHLGVRVWKLS
jgi:ethanolamine utilization microcompartment shell protein EutL